MQTTSPTWKALAARLGAPDALSDSRSVCLEARATVGGTVYEGIAPQVQRATMQNSLAVGNAVAASLLVSLRGAASVPRSASVAIEVRLTDGETASEWLPQGTFYISRRSRDPVTGALALECYDAMLKANAIWTPTAGAWPRTMAAVVAELAGLLGVALDSRTAVPAAAMAEPPAGSTIRDALGTVAQAAGGNWIITPQGRLRLVRVGAAADALDVLGVTGALDVGQTGTVTGVRSTVDGLVTMIGDDTGIVVDVTIGALQAQDMAGELIGQTYQPYALTGAIYDPAAELGDSVRGGAGGEVASVLCAETANYAPAFRGTISAPQGGEMYDEFPYIGGTARALAAARVYAEQAAGSAVEALDASLTQEDIFNRLTDNGAAQGLVFLNGQLYFNASYIRSGTLVLGGLNNQSGTLQVLDAGGNVVGVWDNIGVEIKSGAINATAPGGYVAINAEVSPQYRYALAVLYGTGADQVLFTVDRGVLSVQGGNFDHGVLADSYTRVTPGHISLFGEDNAGMTLTGTAVYPGSSPGQSVTDNSTTRLWNGRIEIMDRNNATWFRLNYEGMIFQGPVAFGDDCDISGALSVGDAAATRANLGAAQHIKFASTDTTAALIYNKIGDLPLQTTVAVYVPGAVADVLTGGKLSGGAYGTMTKFDSSGSYRFLLARANGQYLYGFSCTITSSAITPGTVYRYSGTVI